MSRSTSSSRITTWHARSPVGLGWNQLAIGVGGPPPPYASWMTPIDETYQLAQWCVEPVSEKNDPPILGIML